jgi:hypothetical protein
LNREKTHGRGGRNEEVPEGWIKGFSKKRSMIFYKHKETNVSVWHYPKEGDEIPRIAMRFWTGMAGSAALAQALGMLKTLPKNAVRRHFGQFKLYGEADQQKA